MIKDSGDRTLFETGAVRDMHEGKGRCDILPLDVIGELMGSKTLFEIYNFQCTSDVEHLKLALGYFLETHERWNFENEVILEVAKHFEEGAKKYGENNWRKGIPVKFYIDSAVRHYLKHDMGEIDERHDRAFCWNIICAIWTCKHKPELNDYRKDNENENN